MNVLVSYTWSKSISGPGDVGGLVGGGLAGYQANNPYKPRADRSISIYDLPQRFVATALYDIPFFHNTTGLTKLMLDGFQVSTIVTTISGDALSPGYTGPPVNASKITTRAAADRRPRSRCSTPGRSKIPQLPPSAMHRESISVPLDISILTSPEPKDSSWERRNLQLRADFFNAFKHFNPTASSIDVNLNDTNYGRIGNGTNQQYATRIIQSAGKFYF